MTEPKKFPYEVKVGGSIVTIYRNTERRKKADGTVAQYPYYIVQHYEGVTRVRDRCATWEEVSKSVDEMKEKLKAQDVEALRLTGRDRRVYLAVIERLRDCGIPPEDATKEYADAVKVLAPFQVTVPTAIQQWVDAAKQLNGVPVAHAIQFYVRHGQAIIVIKTVPEIVDELIDFKRGKKRGDYHLRDLKNRLGRFSRAFPGKILDVTTDQIEKWLSSLRSDSQHLKKKGKIEDIEAKTRNNYRGAVVVISKKIAKKRKRRIIPLKPNLRMWLTPFKSFKGRICDRWSKPQTVFQAWDRWGKKIGLHLGENKFRNSYISFRVAETNDVPTTACESGNTEQVIKEDYLELALPEDAKKWFAIQPSAAKQEELQRYAQEFLEQQGLCT